MAEENKKFKLVYEKQGTITGSYSGIPANDDVALIDKAVLDGEEEPAPVPTGTLEITENGIYDVTEYASIDVDVSNEIPEGYIQPTGTEYITDNGTYDIADYANVNVNVPVPDGYILPQGTEYITDNGEFDVSEYERVNVSVQGGELNYDLSAADFFAYIEGNSEPGALLIYYDSIDNEFYISGALFPSGVHGSVANGMSATVGVIWGSGSSHSFSGIYKFVSDSVSEGETVTGLDFTCGDTLTVNLFDLNGYEIGSISYTYYEGGGSSD